MFGGYVTKKKRTEITIATREATIIRRTKPIIRRWCAECAAEVRMATPDKAAAISSVTPRAIYRRVENSEIHFVETDDGHLLICLNSL